MGFFRRRSSSDRGRPSIEHGRPTAERGRAVAELGRGQTPVAPSRSARTLSRMFGVSCAECRLGPASFTQVAAEAYSWASTHDQLHHPARSSAQVISRR
ncbi:MULTISPECIES: hypothetical protein [unclassified Parafrankia]|uniref:hypothetical protein n=1 Tax=unclassified Parafrankia TaxID=2994368 RepID=UPI000DA513C6|nr:MULTISPECIES: hypothetical protein [unclassified Parafrankia]TCJ34794.1 hypothetical protein E0504_31375 [Parafrankia sp. BMG5.11]SQD96826.1 hypothetical protein FMEAI12_3770002 [Parafrankia sp. Ea1.12]